MLIKCIYQLNKFNKWGKNTFSEKKKALTFFG